MPVERLRSTLDELHRELESTENVDAESRELLERTVAEIHELLEENHPSTPPIPETKTLAERLSDSVDRFEADHPDLVHAVGRVLDALGNIGI